MSFDLHYWSDATLEELGDALNAELKKRDDARTSIKSGDWVMLRPDVVTGCGHIGVWYVKSINIIDDVEFANLINNEDWRECLMVPTKLLKRVKDCSPFSPKELRERMRRQCQ